MSIFIFLSTEEREENALYETGETVICMFMAEFFTVIYNTKILP